MKEGKKYKWKGGKKKVKKEWEKSHSNTNVEDSHVELSLFTAFLAWLANYICKNLHCNILHITFYCFTVSLSGYKCF